METFFRRPDRIEQPLDVIVTCFNSARFRNRWKLYEDFITMAERAGKAIRLWTAETAFGQRSFVLPSNPRHLQLRTSQEIWHKERAQNLVLSRVVTQCPDSQYIAFVDADITFARHDWADETRHALQHYSAVQMWGEAYDLDEDSHILQAHTSFAKCYHDGTPISQDGNGNYYYPSGKGRIYWHPGYAWAYRREALDRVGGLIDHAILGSADFHMAHALVGNLKATLRRHLHPNYKNKMRDWERRAEQHIKRNVGFVSGSIFHHYHGAKQKRAYKSRWRILEETQFNPTRDLVTDTQGLYALQHHGTKRSHELRDKTRKYFHARAEDK